MSNNQRGNGNYGRGRQGRGRGSSRGHNPQYDVHSVYGTTPQGGDMRRNPTRGGRPYFRGSSNGNISEYRDQGTFSNSPQIDDYAGNTNRGGRPYFRGGRGAHIGHDFANRGRRVSNRGMGISNTSGGPDAGRNNESCYYQGNEGQMPTSMPREQMSSPYYNNTYTQSPLMNMMPGQEEVITTHTVRRYVNTQVPQPSHLVPQPSHFIQPPSHLVQPPTHLVPPPPLITRQQQRSGNSVRAKGNHYNGRNYNRLRRNIERKRCTDSESSVISGTSTVTDTDQLSKTDPVRAGVDGIDEISIQTLKNRNVRYKKKLNELKKSADPNQIKINELKTTLEKLQRAIHSRVVKEKETTHQIESNKGKDTSKSCMIDIENENEMDIKYRDDKKDKNQKVQHDRKHKFVATSKKTVVFRPKSKRYRMSNWNPKIFNKLVFVPRTSTQFRRDVAESMKSNELEKESTKDKSGTYQRKPDVINSRKSRVAQKRSEKNAQFEDKNGKIL